MGDQRDAVPHGTPAAAALAFYQRDRRWERRAQFQMSDGSPSFSETQQENETDDEFMARCRRVVDTGGGYVILSSVVQYRTDTEFMERFDRG